MGLLEREEWWLTEYCTEIHDYLRHKQRARGAYHGQSPQLHLRRPLVEWMGVVCESRSLCCVVKHVAVNLLDFFMDHYVIEPEQIQLLALTCLLIAAKSEEKDILIPKASDLNSSVEDMYQLSDFVAMEMTLLEFFDWDLLVPTTAHFLDYYALFAISQQEVDDHDGLGSDHNATFYVQKYTHYFLDSALKEQSFIRLPASLVAASCVFATRVCLMLNPAWPATLRKVTGYNWTQLGSCMDKMLRRLEEEETDSNNGSPPSDG